MSWQFEKGESKVKTKNLCTIIICVVFAFEMNANAYQQARYTQSIYRGKEYNGRRAVAQNYTGDYLREEYCQGLIYQKREIKTCSIKRYHRTTYNDVSKKQADQKPKQKEQPTKETTLLIQEVFQQLQTQMKKNAEQQRQLQEQQQMNQEQFQAQLQEQRRINQEQELQFRAQLQEQQRINQKQEQQFQAQRQGQPLLMNNYDTVQPENSANLLIAPPLYPTYLPIVPSAYPALPNVPACPAYNERNDEKNKQPIHVIPGFLNIFEDRVELVSNNSDEHVAAIERFLVDKGLRRFVAYMEIALEKLDSIVENAQLDDKAKLPSLDRIASVGELLWSIGNNNNEPQREAIAAGTAMINLINHLNSHVRQLATDNNSL